MANKRIPAGRPEPPSSPRQRCTQERRLTGGLRFSDCHSSGYPTSQGVVIQQHWQDPQAVAQLIGLGSLSCLGTHLGDIMAHHRDYGDDPQYCRVLRADGIEEFLTGAIDDEMIEFAYLLTPQGWLCANTRGWEPTPLTPLDEAIEPFARQNPRMDDRRHTA